MYVCLYTTLHLIPQRVFVFHLPLTSKKSQQWQWLPLPEPGYAVDTRLHLLIFRLTCYLDSHNDIRLEAQFYFDRTQTVMILILMVSLNCKSTRRKYIIHIERPQLSWFEQRSCWQLSLLH